MKRIGRSISILLSLIFMFTLIACGNSKYTVEDGSKLTKDDMKILRKNYNDLDENQKTELIVMQGKMTDKEFIKFKDDLKKLYVQQMEKDYGSKESAEKMFEESYDYDLRKKQDKLTEQEKKEDIQRQNAAEDFNNKVKEYMEAKDKIQDDLNKNLKNKHDGYIIESKVKDADSTQEKIMIETNILTTKDITVGQMTSIRNEISQEVDNVIKANMLEINLKLNNEDKGTYTFILNKGWDKQIQP
ncbi:hypothetical protein ACXAT3_000153 [Clostridium sporogenes]